MDQQSLPKYQAVHDELLNRLEAGYYSVGTRLPTEQMLAESFGVSRVTVRKALEMLVQSGYVSARQGSGYVVDTLSPPSSTCLVSFTDQVIREGRMPGARLLGVRAPARDVPDSVTALFEEDLALIERLRTVDGKPVMLVRTWVPMRHVAGISAEDFPEEGQDQSILRILANRFRITWSRACEVISSQTAGRAGGAAAGHPGQHADPDAGLYGIRRPARTGVLRRGLPGCAADLQSRKGAVRRQGGQMP